MLCKVDVFVSLTNDGPRMDKKDKLWSMYVDGGLNWSRNVGDDEATNKKS